MLTLTEQDNGRRQVARVGDTVELRLSENATTGYRWALDAHDAAFLEALDETADYPSAAVGSAGEAVFRFRVARAGSGRLSLKYWRSWEGEGSILERFSVTLDVAS
ncbi:hypothetical protein BH10PSE4_BH10PSE4_19390 [soil metagenome]